MSLRIVATERWKSGFPGAMIGILVMRGVANPETDPTLEERARLLEDRIRASLSASERSQLKSLPKIRCYTDYYKRFGKTYHVQLQLESVLFKGKPIKAPGALVQAMLMAELKNMLLTAGHDLGRVRGTLGIDVSQGSETYILLSGKEQVLKAGDMFIRDEAGILSSIIYGPDERTQITPETQGVIFTVYVPPGINKNELDVHLGDLEENVRLFSPDAEVVSRVVIAAG